MDFELSDDQRAYAESARQFAQSEFAPHAARWDEEAIFPREAIAKAGELGFCGLYAPENAWGLALTRLDTTLVFEELAAVDPSTTAFISIHNMATWMLGTWATDEVHRMGAATHQRAETGELLPDRARQRLGRGQHQDARRAAR